MKRQNSDRLGAEGRSWSQGQIRVFTPPPGAEEARSQLRGVRIHTEKEKELIRLKEFWSKSLYHFETGGRGACVDTVFWHVSIWWASGQQRMGRRQGGRRSILGLWARGSIAANGAMEGAGEAASASYLLGFVSFN